MASALLIHVADDIPTFLARIHATKQAWAECLSNETRRQYQGKDTLQVERSIMDACQRETDAYVDALVANVGPEIRGGLRATDKEMMEGLARTGIQTAMSLMDKSPPTTR